ncbi:MAG: cyanophycin synthetase [bacterium]|nr:cyanophycin synthetase [bacterium]
MATRPGITSAYLIGIKGAAMTALAQLLQARGVRVSGSDVPERFFTQDVLARIGIPYVEGFHVDNVPMDVDIVIRSSAYDEAHVEVAVARALGHTVRTYAEVIADIFNAGKGIAVCGTHGKTTTTAMLGLVLAEAGLDPTVIVGSDVPQLGGSARAGRSNLVVLEADEYQDKLRYYKPFGIILTNIEWDHPDFFPTPERYAAAFDAFIAKVPPLGFLIRDVVDVGYDDLTLQVPGAHNRLNAIAALRAAEYLGVPRAHAMRTLASFQGVKRRFEIVGERDSVTIIDDYAHHPTEIRATLAAARSRYPNRRILVIFQPHTFTRTLALRNDFISAFAGAAHVYVMDIFGSAREPHGGITSEELAAALAVPAIASGEVLETIAAVRAALQRGDVVLCLGAGRNDVVARGLAEKI